MKLLEKEFWIQPRDPRRPKTRLQVVEPQEPSEQRFHGPWYAPYDGWTIDGIVNRAMLEQNLSMKKGQKLRIIVELEDA